MRPRGHSAQDVVPTRTPATAVFEVEVEVEVEVEGAVGLVTVTARVHLPSGQPMQSPAPGLRWNFPGGHSSQAAAPAGANLPAAHGPKQEKNI
jgi:hypothetical protein